MIVVSVNYKLSTEKFVWVLPEDCEEEVDTQSFCIRSSLITVNSRMRVVHAPQDEHSLNDEGMQTAQLWIVFC